MPLRHCRTAAAEQPLPHSHSRTATVEQPLPHSHRRTATVAQPRSHSHGDHGLRGHPDSGTRSQPPLTEGDGGATPNGHSGRAEGVRIRGHRAGAVRCRIRLVPHPLASEPALGRRREKDGRRGLPRTGSASRGVEQERHDSALRTRPCWHSGRSFRRPPCAGSFVPTASAAELAPYDELSAPWCGGRRLSAAFPGGGMRRDFRGRSSTHIPGGCRARVRPSTGADPSKDHGPPSGFPATVVFGQGSGEKKGRWSRGGGCFGDWTVRGRTGAEAQLLKRNSTTSPSCMT